MHRYEELEKLYYKKLFLKIFFIIGLILFIIVGLYLFLKKPSKKEIKHQVKVKEINISKPKKEIKKEAIHPVNFILPSIKEEKEIKVNSSKPKKEIKKEEKKELFKEKKVSIKELINKFNSNPNINIALMIANRYLKENNLSEAQKWALKANNINAEDERSWIIFANILVKKGNIKKAKEILNFYLDSYGKNDKIENKLRSLNDK